MRRKNKQVIFVEVPETLKDRVKLAAHLLSSEARQVTISDFTKEAVDEKLDKLAKKHPELAAA